MTDFLEIAGLGDIADRYDATFCDVWGVIHNGRAAFQPACDALAKFRDAGGKVILITNAPVPKQQVIRYFKPLGVPDGVFDDCVSSGDATRAVLETYAGNNLWLMGADSSFDGDRALWNGVDITFTDGPDGARAMLCMGMDDNANDNPEDYRDVLKTGVRAGLPMICANPDIQVRVGDRLVWCAGALAAIYEQEGGSVIYPGKPHPVIYDAARARLAALGTSPESARILAIGDGPVTDIRGANRERIDSLYVGSGLAAADQGDFADQTRRHLAEAGVAATFAMPALEW